MADDDAIEENVRLGYMERVDTPDGPKYRLTEAGRARAEAFLGLAGALDPHSDATLEITLRGDWQQFCALLIAIQCYRLELERTDPDDWPGDPIEIDVQRLRMEHFAAQLIAAGIDSGLDDVGGQPNG